MNVEIIKTDSTLDCGRFFLDVSGLFGPGDLSIQWVDQPRQTNPQVERMIEKTWRKCLHDAGLQGHTLFDGRLCRLASVQRDGAKLNLSIGLTGYREFLGTNAFNSNLIHKYGQEVLANPVGISATIISSDGYVLLGLRSSNVMLCPGCIHPIGGIMDAPEQLSGSADPFAAMAGELEQEIALVKGSIRQIVCIGLVRDKKTVQPELIFDVHTDVDVATIRQNHLQAVDADEHSELITMRDHPAIVVDFLSENRSRMTPIAQASLLLHGLRHWGSGWLAAARGYICGVV